MKDANHRLFIGPRQTFKTYENRQQVKVINYFKKAPPQTFIIHVGTINAPHSSSYEMFHEIQSLRNFILKYLPSARITVSTPILRVDKASVNDINKNFTELLKESNLDYISHKNIK